MDYGRLFLFMAAATSVMATGTHLWCWVYSVVRKMVLRREMLRMYGQLALPDPEDEAVDRRRFTAQPYRTYEQFRTDVVGMAIPLDDILDRLNGQMPPKEADLPKLDTTTPTGALTSTGLQQAISGQALVAGLGVLLLMIYYDIPLNAKAVEILVANLREKDRQSKPPAAGSGS